MFSLLRDMFGHQAWADAEQWRAIEAVPAARDADLAEQVSIPWFKDRALTITRAEALTQAVMHSQWHRGQNSTRLRELGATPPTLDLIVWYWIGKPARWEER